MSTLITGVFNNRQSAEQAVADLHALGYSQNDISVVMTDQTKARDFAYDTGSKASEGAGIGAGIGGVLGGIVAALTATGSVAAIAATGGAATPLVAGPLAAALAGAGAGGLGGGVIGGLIGAGIPEDRARLYETELNQGGILVGVYADANQQAQVNAILQQDGAANVQQSGPTNTQTVGNQTSNQGGKIG